MFCNESVSAENKIELLLQEKLNKKGIKGFNKINVSKNSIDILQKIEEFIDLEIELLDKVEEIVFNGLTLSDLQFDLPYNIKGYNLFFTGGAYSWKGDYSTLALDLFENDYNDGLSLKDILDISEIEGEYEGWKGGKYFLGQHSSMKIALNDGNYQIYSINNPTYKDLFNDWLKNGDVGSTIKIDNDLSSDGNDKCPYISYAGYYDNRGPMVFTSDRPGGQGGFDIYYSTYNNDTEKWSTPRNIGGKINNSYNEYRPSLYRSFGYKRVVIRFATGNYVGNDSPINGRVKHPFAAPLII